MGGTRQMSGMKDLDARPAKSLRSSLNISCFSPVTDLDSMTLVFISGAGCCTHSALSFCAGGKFLSVQAISWVIDQSKHKGNTFVVLLMIANHAKSDGTGAWPSVSTLSKESRLSRRTVQRCVSRLSHPWSGRADWHKDPPELNVRIGKGPYGSNLYDIPGVKLTQGGRHSVTGGASDSDAGGASPVSPNPSLTVNKDKEAFVRSVETKIKDAEKGAKQRFIQGYVQHHRDKKAVVQ